MGRLPHHRQPELRGSANDWASAQLSTCGSTALVNPPNDIQVCNGQLVDTVNDGGTVTSLAMYPKQPFDFAGRTGTIAFDVSNDTQGSHAGWPELWVSDQPVPDPFTHEGWQPAPERVRYPLRGLHSGNMHRARPASTRPSWSPTTSPTTRSSAAVWWSPTWPA